MRFVLEFRPDARIEFDDAADWYENHRAGLRSDFVHAIHDALGRIKKAPLTFPVVEGTFVRRAVVNQFPYSIFFSLNEEVVVVFAVFHHSRNPMIWRGRVD